MLSVTVRTADWKQAVANDARMTQGLEENQPLSLLLWEDMLHAEHSPIRSLEFAITWTNIPYWVTVHLDRHHVGVQPFTRSQRPDSIKPVEYVREKAPQDAPVTFRLVLNTQALINISRRRLCQLASPETREAWCEVQSWFITHDDPYMKAIGMVMQPDCIYRGRVCHAPKKQSCRRYPHWRKFKW